MTDEELPCGVGKFLREFWGEGSSFYECVVGWAHVLSGVGGKARRQQANKHTHTHNREYLRERGDKEVKVGAWTPKEEQDAYSGESFRRVREVFYSRVRVYVCVYERELFWVHDR